LAARTEKRVTTLGVRIQAGCGCSPAPDPDRNTTLRTNQQETWGPGVVPASLEYKGVFMIKRFASRAGPLLLGIWVIILVTSITGINLVPAASKHQARTAGTVSSVMVADLNGNNLPNWGDTVTFNVSTTATQYPSVELDCYQNGSLVYTHSAGFYATYPWPQSQNYILQSYVWTGGAADCTAKLYYMNSRGLSVTLTTLSIPVSP